MGTGANGVITCPGQLLKLSGRGFVWGLFFVFVVCLVVFLFVFVLC